MCRYICRIISLRKIAGSKSKCFCKLDRHCQMPSLGVIAYLLLPDPFQHASVLPKLFEFFPIWKRRNVILGLFKYFYVLGHLYCFFYAKCLFFIHDLNKKKELIVFFFLISRNSLYIREVIPLCEVLFSNYLKCLFPVIDFEDKCGTIKAGNNSDVYLKLNVKNNEPLTCDS